jgi:hypothetical protein
MSKWPYLSAYGNKPKHDAERVVKLLNLAPMGLVPAIRFEMLLVRFRGRAILFAAIIRHSLQISAG